MCACVFTVLVLVLRVYVCVCVCVCVHVCVTWCALEPINIGCSSTTAKEVKGAQLMKHGSCWEGGVMCVCVYYVSVRVVVVNGSVCVRCVCVCVCHMCVGWILQVYRLGVVVVVR
jgi:hypothetical protein